MSPGTASKFMPFHDTGKAFALRDAAYGNPLALFEDVDSNHLPLLELAGTELTKKTMGRHTCLFEVTFHGLGHAALFLFFFKSQLDRLIPIPLGGLFLDHGTGTGLDHGH